MTKWATDVLLIGVGESCADRVEFVINYRGSKDRDENAHATCCFNRMVQDAVVMLCQGTG